MYGWMDVCMSVWMWHFLVDAISPEIFDIDSPNFYHRFSLGIGRMGLFMGDLDPFSRSHKHFEK